MQVSYTFSRDFISLLLKDGSVATDFGRTEVLLKGLRRVSHFPLRTRYTVLTVRCDGSVKTGTLEFKKVIYLIAASLSSACFSGRRISRTFHSLFSPVLV